MHRDAAPRQIIKATVRPSRLLLWFMPPLSHFEPFTERSLVAESLHARARLIYTCTVIHVCTGGINKTALGLKFGQSERITFRFKSKRIGLGSKIKTQHTYSGFFPLISKCFQPKKKKSNVAVSVLLMKSVQPSSNHDLVIFRLCVRHAAAEDYLIVPRSKAVI